MAEIEVQTGKRVLFLNPKAVRDVALGHKTVEERQHCALTAIPEEVIREYFHNAAVAPNPATLAIYRAQFIKKFPDLFKPNLSEIEGGKYKSHSNDLFKDNKGIFKHFDETVLDVIKYKEGPRRPKEGANKETGAKPENGLFFEFGRDKLVTDIPITGTDEKDKLQKANAFIETMQAYLAGCSCKFVVHKDKESDGGGIYVRTDMDEPTFGMLGSMIAAAAHTELSEKEHIARMRKGQARVWEAEGNLKNLEIGRAIFPGTFEMCVIATPGSSFRPDVELNKDGEVAKKKDPTFIKTRKAPEPDLYYRGSKKVLEMVSGQSEDGRDFYQVEPARTVKEAIKAEWKGKFKTIEGILKIVPKFVKPFSLAQEALFSITAARRKGKHIVAAVKESNEIFEGDLAGRQSVYNKAQAIEAADKVKAADVAALMEKTMPDASVTRLQVANILREKGHAR